LEHEVTNEIERSFVTIVLCLLLDTGHET